MVTEMNHKVKQPITDFYNGDHIDHMTKKWLCQTPHPPQIPEFFPCLFPFRHVARRNVAITVKKGRMKKKKDKNY